jgi:hypothetical protein
MLRAQLHERASNRGQLAMVTVQADQEADFIRVAEVLEACRSAGVTNVTIGADLQPQIHREIERLTAEAKALKREASLPHDPRHAIFSGESTVHAARGERERAVQRLEALDFPAERLPAPVSQDARYQRPSGRRRMPEKSNRITKLRSCGPGWINCANCLKPPVRNLRPKLSNVALVHRQRARTGSIAAQHDLCPGQPATSAKTAALSLARPAHRPARTGHGRVRFHLKRRDRGGPRRSRSRTGLDSHPPATRGVGIRAPNPRRHAGLVVALGRPSAGPRLRPLASGYPHRTVFLVRWMASQLDWIRQS